MTTATGSQPYFLSPHVRLCATTDHIVMMDLRRDRYVGVSAAEWWILARHVRNWPASLDPEAVGVFALQTSLPDPGTVLTKMQAAGLLTVHASAAPVPAPALPRVESVLVREALEFHPPVSSIQLVRFLYAWAFVSVTVRCRSIETIAARIAARKACYMNRHPACEGDTLRKCQPLVAAYLYLRPLFFTARDKCLHDSLALIEFLAAYNLFPVWTIGVSTLPFKAHSWVQQANVVFNDSPEYVRRFTPILSA